MFLPPLLSLVIIHQRNSQEMSRGFVKGRILKSTAPYKEERAFSEGWLEKMLSQGG